MGAAKRAFLYLVRKRSKSILLFVILLVLTTLVLSAVSIGNAAEEAAGELRRTLGGYFKLEENLEYSGKRDAITDSFINRIGSIDGVKASNRMNIEYLITPGLTLEAGRFTAEGDEKAKLARFLGNSDSSLHEYFLLRSLQLAEGRHIGPDDAGKAVISRKLAEINGLSVGDTISAGYYSGDVSGGDAFQAYDWEIAGIFDINTAQESGGTAAECDMADNFIFADMSSMMEIQTDRNPQSVGKYRGASFFADDPEQLNTIIEKVYEIKGVNWDSFELNVNDKAYRKAVSPLERLGGYTNLFLWVIIAVSVVLLSLVLIMWMRDRVHEIGVLLSVGIKKTSLIGQYLLEVLAVLLLALAAAFPVSSAAAGFAGNAFLGNMPREEIREEKNSFEIFYEPMDLSEAAGAEDVTVAVGAGEFLFAALYGVSVSLAAVGLSSVLIMRLKPRDILSAMS